MEMPPDSSGTSLRWWQEPTPQPQWWRGAVAPPVEVVASPVALMSEPLDVGEELEAEAVRRAALEKDAVVITGDWITGTQKRQSLWWGVLLCPSMILIMGLLNHFWLPVVLSFFVIAEYFLRAAIVRRQFAASKPRLIISSLGLRMEAPFYRIENVFWHEIQSVRVTNTSGIRTVSVTMKDEKTLSRALVVKPGAMGWIAGRCLSKTRLEISDHWFAESAEQIAAQIVTFRPASESSAP